MDLDELAIPVRSIKSVDSKTSITKNANSKFFVCNTNQPVPLIIKPTQTLDIQHRFPQPIGENSYNGSGFLGEIKSLLIGDGDTVQTQLVRARDVALKIARGGHFTGDLIVIRKGGKVSPAHVPDLSDLAMLPKPLKIAIQRILLDEGGTKGDGYEHVIPKSIKNILDPCSVLPRIRESCVLMEGDHLMHTNSDSNDIKIISVGGVYLWKKLSLVSNWTSKNPLDGRKIATKFEVTVAPTATAVCRIVTWNCRDMARKSFTDNLGHVISVHVPDILILTETRVSINMARVICQPVHARIIKGRSRCGVIGGYVVMIFSKNVGFQLDEQTELGSKWAIQQK